MQAASQGWRLLDIEFEPFPLKVGYSGNDAEVGRQIGEGQDVWRPGFEKPLKAFNDQERWVVTLKGVQDSGNSGHDVFARAAFPTRFGKQRVHV